MSGSWQPLKQQPTFFASTMLLLTDGTVMCQESGGRNWWRLTPDATGNYVKVVQRIPVISKSFRELAAAG